jgi:hypothetical protein
MDWLQFIDAMVGHVAWPLVVLIIVFAVRKHLGSLAERILELSFGGATVKFDKLLSKGAEIIKHAPAIESFPADAEPGLTEPHKDIKASNILDNEIINIFHAYRMTEMLADEAAEKLGVKTRNPRAILAMLHRRGLVSEEIVKLHETLREARNAALHGAMFSITDAEAAEFIRQALYVNLALKQASKQLQLDKKNREPPKEDA